MTPLERFFWWINERHAIYLKRQAGSPFPWSSDVIMNTYRFCNVFRELDAVTIWLRQNWREPYADHPHLWFAMCVARMINWPPTLKAIGFPGGRMAPWMDTALGVMRARAQAGMKVYTGAYMLKAHPEGGDKPDYTINYTLGPLWEKRESFEALWASESIQPVRLIDFWELLRSFYSWGDFLSYEVTTDLRHTRYLRNAPDIMKWAPAGPGAMRGLNRISLRPLKQQLDQTSASVEMSRLLRMSPQMTGPHVPALEMRDIEHSLCEFDKYSRALEGSGRPRELFRPHKEPPCW